MTIKELKSFRHIQAEVEAFDAVAQDCRQRIAQLIEADKLYRQAEERFPTSTTEATGYEISMRQTVTAYREMEKRAIDNALHLVQMKTRIENYLLSIPDAELRQAFALRYLKGMTWQEVASALGGYATVENVKKRVQRYMNKTG